MTGDQASISGELRCDAKTVTARLERELAHAPETVWHMLTDSICLADWLAPGTLEARRGGRVKLDFGNSGMPIDCLITECHPYRRLAYSWSSGDAPVRPLVWELTPGDGVTHLSLTLVLPRDELVPIACAGWDAHLEMLMAALEGIRIHFPATRFREARARFESLLEEQAA